MNNKSTFRIRAFLPSFVFPFFLIVLSFGQLRAATTTFSTDSSWRVTSTNFPNWNTVGYVLNSSWLLSGPGNVNCGVAQTGVVGASKIWYPATNSLRTCYFRKNFPISQLCEVKSVTIDIAAADTYILYVNGIAIASGGASAKTVNIPIQVLQCENVIAIQARDTDAKCWWMSAKVTINSTAFAFTASSNSTSSNPVCAGQTLNLTSTGLAGSTYAWTGPSGFTSNQQNPTVSSVSAIDTGDYIVTVKIGKCCSYMAKTYVNIKNCKECLELSIKDIVCKNGVYNATICIKNNSSHTATNINLISSTPGVTYSPNTFTPPGGLLSGQTYCKNVVISGSGAASGATICLKAMLIEIKDCKQTWFCTSQDDFCVQLPECVKPCEWRAVVKDSIITICKGTSVGLAASTLPFVSGASYVWTSTPASTIINGNTATPMVTPLANPTVYTVTVTTINTDGTLCKKNVKVIVNLKDCSSIPCDSVKLGFIPNTINLCLGDSVQLNPVITPSSGLTYLWTPSTGLSNASIKNPWAKPTVTTSYNLIVSVAGTTCKKNASVNLIVKSCPPPCTISVAVKDSVIRICRGSQATLMASSSLSSAVFNWTPVTSIISGANSVTAVVSPLTTTTYTVTAKDTSKINCFATGTVRVEVADCGVIPNSSRTSSDNESSDEIMVSPNPTQSVISVQIPDSFNWKSATLINSRGMILNELQRTDNAKLVKFDVQSQPSGIYIISVKTDKGFVNKKVMKE